MEIKSIIEPNFVIMSDDETVVNVLKLFRKYEKQSALIFRNKKYMGIIEKKKLLKSRMDIQEAKIKKFIIKTPILNINDNVLDAARLISENNVEFLPVEENKKIVGVIDQTALVNKSLDLEEIKLLKVKNIKLEKISKIKMEDPIVHAMRLMQKYNVDQIPVYDKLKVAGIVSYKDVLRKYLQWNPKKNFSSKFNVMASKGMNEIHSLAELPVKDFSTNEGLLTIRSENSLKKAIKEMERHSVQDLLVYEKGKFKGLLTIKNILKRIATLKIPREHHVKYIGIKKAGLTTEEKYILKKITEHEAYKIQRKVKKFLDITIHVKSAAKLGNKKRYEVHVKIECKGKLYPSKAEEWNIELALRKAFTGVEAKFN
jgi:predicted transcriptional regulator